jgi:large subunit ribosomal protein L17
MRHGNKGSHLGRTVQHRRALLSNLSISLITHKRIETTLVKAKALRQYIEPLVTKAKDNTTHSRRVVFSYLQNKFAIQELFGPIATEVGNRPGGYVRVIRTGFRKGDGAETALIEFVDFNPDYYGKVKTEGADVKRSRTRRGSKKAAAAKATAPAAQVTEKAQSEGEE